MKIKDLIKKIKEGGKRKEKCAVCGTKTVYLKSTPINNRMRYVEGVGQLCNDCWKIS
jgi:hypothetical protein